jgi:hypothetical protein
VSSQEAYLIEPGMEVVVSDAKNSIVGTVDLVGMSVSYDNAGKAVNAPWLLESYMFYTEWVSPVILKVDDSDIDKLAINAELKAKIVLEERTPYKILFD